MNNIGYEIYEPEILGYWFGTVKNQTILVALLTWLVVRVRAKLIDKCPGVTVDVIPVEYIGRYPAIGIRTDNDSPKNMPDILDVLIKEILSKTSVFEFVKFIFTDDVDWSAVTNELMNPTVLE